MPRQDTIERFWSRVDAAALSGCWKWIGTLNESGYGAFFTRRAPESHLRDQLAHRFSYRLHIGPIPKGIAVLHRCDNRACVNPAHLFLGTWQDNADDMVAKSRQARGERIGRARLTVDQVVAIRCRYAAGGVSTTDLSREYGICREGIWEIVSRKTWKHV